MNATPIRIFDSIFYDRINVYMGPLGGAMLRPGFRPNARTALSIGIIVSFLLSGAYTLAAYDTVTRLKCLALFGMGLQGIAKYTIVLWHSDDICVWVTFLRRIYARNAQTGRPAARAVLRRWAGRTAVVMRVGTAVIIVTTLLYVPECALESLMAGHRVPMLNAMVPGLPVDGDHGRNYALVFAYHLLLVLLAGLGTCAGDMLQVMLAMHVPVLCELFEEQLRELNAVLAGRPAAEWRGRPELALFVRNAVQMHKEIGAFMRSLSTMYYLVYFVEVYSNALSLCVLNVCFVQIEWIGVYPLFVLFLSKLFAYCFLGTLTELGADRMYAALLACDWYDLPAAQQRQYLLMVRSAQRPAALMAGTVPLNLDTFVSVSIARDWDGRAKFRWGGK